MYVQIFLSKYVSTIQISMLYELFNGNINKIDHTLDSLLV